MRYLIKTTEQYRCDSEGEATGLIEEVKRNGEYVLTKSSSEIRTVKQKGEVVDEWYRVTLTKVFTEEKEPDRVVVPSYEEAE